MAFRAPDVYTDVAGQTVFTITPNFANLQEFVYINGFKKVRTVDYVVSQSQVGQPEDEFDTITLNDPIADASDIIEIQINDVDTSVSDLSDKIDELLVESLGSWAWDKGTGILTMYDTLGVERFKFSVSDDSDSASRERRQDLEV